MRGRGRILAALLALSPHAAQAQYVATERYSAPPSTFVTPTDFSVAGVTTARGNLAQWRDEQRRRIGPYRRELLRTGQFREQNALPPVAGYFVVFEGGRALPGIVHGRWSVPGAEIGQRQAMRHLRYARPYQVCGAPHETANVDIEAVAYLGNAWRPEFDTLDEQLSATRTIAGEELARTDPVMGYDPAPSTAEFSRFYPVDALMRERQGRADLSCFVNADRSLRCGIASEDPTGFEFGEAARHIIEIPRVRVPEQDSTGQATPGRCIHRGVVFLLAN